MSTPGDHYKFGSTCLPKNYKYHEQVGGEFNKDGSCRFNNWEEIDRTVKHANANGERIYYAGRRKTIYPD